MLILLQTPPPEPDKIINTALVCTKAIAKVAIIINNALTPGMGDGKFSEYIALLYVVMMILAFVMLAWEFLNLLLDAGTGEHEQQFGWRKLFDTGFIKRVFRFGILGGLATLLYFYQYEPGKLSADQKADAKTYVSLMDPIKLIVLETPPANPTLDTSIVGTIKQCSNQLGAYYFVTQAQETTAKVQARNAGLKVWEDINKNSTQVNVEDNSGFLKSLARIAAKVADWEKLLGDLIMRFFLSLANQLTALGASLVLLFMNFGLDVMIVRTLMFNAIYMMMGYKIAVLVLPVALIAAYWRHWESVLRGVIQVMIVTTISLNVLADLTRVFFNKDTVIKVVADTTAQALPADKKAYMEEYARKVYMNMTDGSSGSTTIKKEDYISAVVDDKGSISSGAIFNIDAAFWAPVRVIMMLTILVALLGKIGTVINDTISGTMTFHR